MISLAAGPIENLESAVLYLRTFFVLFCFVFVNCNPQRRAITAHALRLFRLSFSFLLPIFSKKDRDILVQ